MKPGWIHVVDQPLYVEWVVPVIVLPFAGVLVYLLAHHDAMREARETADGSATEIVKAKAARRRHDHQG